MKKDIILLHYNLVLGGVEKVLLNLLKNLDRNKFNIKLILFEKKGEFLKEIPDDIEVFYLDVADNGKKKTIFGKILKTLKNIYFYKKQLKKIIKNKKDILLIINSRCWIINTVLVLFKNKKIGWIHGNILNDYGTIIEKLNYKLLNQYKIIYNISKEGKKDFDEKFPNFINKSRILYNSFNINEILEKSGEDLKESNEKYILAAARLMYYEKGYDVLLKSLKLLKDEGINKRLYILGDGPEKDKINREIIRLDLKDNIKIIGFERNPYKWIKNAELFILPSRGEGFGLVILEALICKTPVVSTDCKCGPNEILDNGKYGVLVPVGDELSLKEGIKKILKDNKLSETLKEKGYFRALDFSNEKILKKLENDILELQEEK